MRRYATVATLLILAAAAWFIAARREVFSPLLRQVSPFFVLLIALAAVAHLYVEALRFRTVLRIFGLSVPFREWFGLTVCNTMVGYTLPGKGGGALRALYLKHRYRFPLARYASLIAGASLLCFALSAMLGLASLILLVPVSGEWHPQLGAVFFLLLLLSAGGMLFLGFLGGRRFTTPSARLNAVIENFTGGLPYYRSGGRLVALFAGYHVLSLLVLSLRLWLAFEALGLEVRPLSMVVMESLAGCSLVLSATPGNLGVTEGIVAFSAAMMKISAEKAALAAILDRAVMVPVVFILGLVFSHLVLKELPALRRQLGDRDGPPAAGRKT